MSETLLQILNSPIGVLYAPVGLGMALGWYLDLRRGVSTHRFRLWAYLLLPLGLAIWQPIMLDLTMAAAPRSIDPLLAAWDDALFGGPAVTWGRFIYGHPGRMIAVALWYSSLPAFIAIGIATARQPIVALIAFALVGTLGSLLYWLTPALGPAQAVTGFPVSMAWQLVPAGICNGFPSLHTAAAMTGLYCAPGRLRLAWSIYAAGLVFCCVATGQHWLIDCGAGTLLAWVMVQSVSLVATRFQPTKFACPVPAISASYPNP